MRSFKPFLSALALVPMLSLAAPFYTEQETDLAPGKSFSNVPLACYAGFRAVVELLPELSHQLNLKMGKELLVIDNVETPNGMNNVFEFDILKGITPAQKGHYTLAQVYNQEAKTLSLTFTTKIPGQADKLWEMLEKGMTLCADNLPDNPGIPG